MDYQDGILCHTYGTYCKVTAFGNGKSAVKPKQLIQTTICLITVPVMAAATKLH